MACFKAFGLSNLRHVFMTRFWVTQVKIRSKNCPPFNFISDDTGTTYSTRHKVHIYACKLLHVGWANFIKSIHKQIQGLDPRKKVRPRIWLRQIRIKVDVGSRFKTWYNNLWIKINLSFKLFNFNTGGYRYRYRTGMHQYRHRYVDKYIGVLSSVCNCAFKIIFKR